MLKRILFTVHSSLFSKAIAFTLAETLIVMGIIGVVAALTLPNLNSSTGEKEKVAKVKKIYSNLNDAFGRTTAIYGPVNEWFKNDSDAISYSKRFTERVLEFLKTTNVKNCNTVTCYSYTNFLDLSGSTAANMKDAMSVNLPDGTELLIRLSAPNCDKLKQGSALSGHFCGTIYADIDGSTKGTHTYGKDIFAFYITNEGIVPMGYSGEGLDVLNETPLKGMQATGWVIENENMDYLKCKDKLSWTNTSCK